MKAIAHLIIVVMQEAGKVPLQSAMKVANAFMGATVGKKYDDIEEQ